MLKKMCVSLLLLSSFSFADILDYYTMAIVPNLYKKYPAVPNNIQNGKFTVYKRTAFYDDGGSTGNYNEYAEYTMTIYPATPGKKVSVRIDSLLLEGSDRLKFYNGDSTSADYIGAVRYSFSSNSVLNTTITSTAEDGSLTIFWDLDGWGSNAGWVGEISEVSSVSYLTMRDSSFTMEAGKNVTFYDMGGTNAAYDNGYYTTVNTSGQTVNDPRTLTIYPSSPGKKVSIRLDAYEGESFYDFLKFYDGNSTSADYIGALTSSFSYDPAKNTTITSTAPDGSLTIALVTDDNRGGAGWVGEISEVDSVSYLTLRRGEFTMEAGKDVTFYDIGGTNTNYDYFQYTKSIWTGETVLNPRTLTIYPSSPGKKVSIEMFYHYTEGGYDYLKVYNGNSSSAPLLQSWGGNYGSTVPNPVQTSSAADGSLTISLTTDTSRGYDGWVSIISEQ